MNPVVQLLKFYKEIGVEYVRSVNLKTKIDIFKEIEKEVINCRKCSLYKSRTNVVFGEGSLDADLMFVGEAPGRDEDIQGKPFVGRAGRLLRDLLKEVGIDIGNVYIANCLKCRPPNNRDPLPEELVSCFGYLRKQIEVIDPKVIATLGRYSTYELTNQKGALGTLRGRIFDYHGIRVIPLYHPAYLLRNPKAVGVFLEDLKKVKELLEQ